MAQDFFSKMIFISRVRLINNERRKIIIPSMIKREREREGERGVRKNSSRLLIDLHAGDVEDLICIEKSIA
jgi:hypothetical protein